MLVQIHIVYLSSGAYWQTAKRNMRIWTSCISGNAVCPNLSLCATPHLCLNTVIIEILKSLIRIPGRSVYMQVRGPEFDSRFCTFFGCDLRTDYCALCTVAFEYKLESRYVTGQLTTREPLRHWAVDHWTLDLILFDKRGSSCVRALG